MSGTSNGSFFAEIGAADLLLETNFQATLTEAQAAATTAQAAATTVSASISSANASASSASSSASSAATSATAAAASATAAAASATTAVAGLLVNQNKLINPFFMIDQQNEGSAVGDVATSFSGYVADGCLLSYVSSGHSGIYSAQRNQTTPEGTTGHYSVVMFTNVAATSVGAGDYAELQFSIEGNRLVDTLWGSSSALPLTVSFWAKASLSGTYAAGLSDAAGTRAYMIDFTLTANVWQKVTFTVPGDTATGIWAIPSNNAAMLFRVSANAGSTYQVPAPNAWHTGVNGLATPNTSNAFMTTASANLYVSRPKIEIGSSATPLQRLPLADDLAECQRYYEKSYNSGTKPATLTSANCVNWEAPAGSVGQFPQEFKVTKRAAPSITLYSYTTGSTGVISNSGVSDLAATVGSVGLDRFTYALTGSPLGGLNNLVAHWVADARM